MRKKFNKYFTMSNLYDIIEDTKWVIDLSAQDPLGQLAFVIRWERGEIGGLPHCHIFISRFPERSINPSTCFAMVNTWKHGIA